MGLGKPGRLREPLPGSLIMTSSPHRHDTGSTTARSVDEIALIRDTINP
jgi:hypothetical protein